MAASKQLAAAGWSWSCLWKWRWPSLWTEVKEPPADKLWNVLAKVFDKCNCRPGVCCYVEGEEELRQAKLFLKTYEMELKYLVIGAGCVLALFTALCCYYCCSKSPPTPAPHPKKYMTVRQDPPPAINNGPPVSKTAQDSAPAVGSHTRDGHHKPVNSTENAVAAATIVMKQPVLNEPVNEFMDTYNKPQRSTIKLIPVANASESMQAAAVSDDESSVTESVEGETVVEVVEEKEKLSTQMSFFEKDAGSEESSNAQIVSKTLPATARLPIPKGSTTAIMETSSFPTNESPQQSPRKTKTSALREKFAGRKVETASASFGQVHKRRELANPQKSERRTSPVRPSPSHDSSLRNRTSSYAQLPRTSLLGSRSVTTARPASVAVTTPIKDVSPKKTIEALNEDSFGDESANNCYTEDVRQEARHSGGIRSRRPNSKDQHTI